MRLVWRWDQGRTKYFMTDTLVHTARVLLHYEGKSLSNVGISLKNDLIEATDLPFLPDDYFVWRNYARIFKLAQLASKVDGCIATSQLCSRLALVGSLTSDDYLLHFTRTCVFPNPAFSDFVATARVYPACAVIRLLMSTSERVTKGIDAHDVIAYIAGNEVYGSESPEEFASLSASSEVPKGDEERQVREFLRFLSQLSFLSFSGGRLYFDGAPIGSAEWNVLWGIVAPEPRSLPVDAELAVLELGKNAMSIDSIATVPETSSEAISFDEGTRVQRLHARIERSPALRRLYLAAASKPVVCDACALESDKRYPWTSDLFELHHLLPLASAVRVGKFSTSLDDLEPLCSTCHQAVHRFYKMRLTELGRMDFRSSSEAKNVYEDAKSCIVL